MSKAPADRGWWLCSAGLDGRAVLIVTSGAVQDAAFASPVFNPFAVSTERPVFCLPRMTLGAHDIGIIESEFFTFQGPDASLPVEIVTGETPELPLPMESMLKQEIVMRFQHLARFEVTHRPRMTIGTGVHVRVPLARDHPKSGNPGK
jgi:hypothetical protein